MPRNIFHVADLVGLRGPTWRFWHIVLGVLFGLSLTPEQEAVALRHTGRSRLFSEPIRELFLCVGRRGGKSRIIAFIATFLACFCDYSSVLAPGETGVVLLVAPSQRQARVLLSYVIGFLRSVRMLSRMIVEETEFAIELNNNIVIEVHSANFRTVRGFTLIAALVDEVAFLPQDDSAIPDTELLGAIRPAMGTIKNSLLIWSSTPHAPRGELYKAYRSSTPTPSRRTPAWTSPSSSRLSLTIRRSRRQSTARAGSSSSAPTLKGCSRNRRSTVRQIGIGR